MSDTEYLPALMAPIRAMATGWDLMRAAAIERHRFLNVHFEDSCPKKWATHMAIVRAFYGW
jgi:hypothetical protein